MHEHGDEIFEVIEHALGELPTPDKNTSWAGMACLYVSTAVEVWASDIDLQIEDARNE